MQPTRCLYDEKPYEVEFEAQVLSCEKGEKGYQVILDQTQFFPEQGGQTPDQGSLHLKKPKTEENNVRVLDVQITDGIIIHTTDAPLEEESRVVGSVDWDYRFSNMQQHTGEHIFSGLVHEKYGYNNVGFHLSDSVVTMDFDGTLDKTQVKELERKANQVIYANLPVEVSYPTKEELAALEYRSKKELEGQVRIVTIPGVDVCACCAPHVSHTGEIGQLKVMQLQNYKGGVRLSILCGYRALEAFSEKKDTVEKMMHLLSSSEEDLESGIKRLQTENQETNYRLRKTMEQLLLCQVKGLDETEENPILFVGDCDTKAMRDVVNEMVKTHPGYCGIFTGDDQTGYRFIVGSATKDCSQLATLMREQLGVRGGGGAQMIQGSAQVSRENLENFLSDL
ncbi:MAG: alanyl-tRNA editing protein [Lachnospiraceae bacterium]|nr:alanyl-tRNA editing protein [Lachnospiraceae bacterium]MDD6191854.1 alanyl-tRNA editing protein [Lachnospiraceae bacterium]MDY4793500.1 alanyl-tRNA editing protein [Pararoseburia sp.]